MIKLETKCLWQIILHAMDMALSFKQKGVLSEISCS